MRIGLSLTFSLISILEYVNCQLLREETECDMKMSCHVAVNPSSALTPQLPSACACGNSHVGLQFFSSGKMRAAQHGEKKKKKASDNLQIVSEKNLQSIWSTWGRVLASFCSAVQKPKDTEWNQHLWQSESRSQLFLGDYRLKMLNINLPALLQFSIKNKIRNIWALKRVKNVQTFVNEVTVGFIWKSVPQTFCEAPDESLASEEGRLQTWPSLMRKNNF